MRRGFVRAHAPVLDIYGVDQRTFLSFIKNFDQAAQASPPLDVVFISAGAVGFVPDGFATLTSTLAQIAVGIATENQKSSRGNSYMDQMNEQLFTSRGLYALVMTYTPDAHEKPIGTQQMDINEIISGRQKPSWNTKGRPITKGDTCGDLELPEAAPLIFPGMYQATQEKLANESAWKKSKRFLSHHHEMRCQARWVSFSSFDHPYMITADRLQLEKHPESRLNLPSEQLPQFKTKLGALNHPPFSGGLVTLLSGGRIGGKRNQRSNQTIVEQHQSSEEKRLGSNQYDYSDSNASSNSNRRPKSVSMKISFLPYLHSC